MIVKDLRDCLKGVSGNLPVLFGTWSQLNDEDMGLIHPNEACVMDVVKTDNDEEIEAFVILQEEITGA